MKLFLLTGVAVCSLALAGSEPVQQWNFEKWDAKGVCSPSLPQKGEKVFSLSGMPAGKNGVNGSNALVCGNTKRSSFGNAGFCGEWRAFTMELKFKLDGRPDSKRGNALFCYGKHSWNRAQFLLWITPKGQLEGKFRLVSGDGRKSVTEVKASSEVLTFEPGRFYTVRVASASGGAMKIWLDGQLVAVREKGSFGFSDLQCKIPQGYPLFVIGSDLANIETVYRPLNGIVDDVKIWNSFEEPSVLDSSTGAGEAHLFLKEGGSAETTPFQVLDRPGEALGSFVRPEQKFLDAAAHAQIALTPKDLIVTFHCPIAAGTGISDKGTSVWSGDLVEFFLRPNLRRDAYFQYAANASGKAEFLAWNSPAARNPDFKSSATHEVSRQEKEWVVRFTIPRAEVGLASIPAGKIVTVNFTRSGPSCGGLSTWAPVGEAFHTINRFQPLVFESRKSALRRELSESRAEFDAIPGGSSERAEVAADLARIADEIEKKGDEPASFSALRGAIAGMRTRYTGLRFASTPSLIWTPPLPWGNDIQVSPLSKKTEKISLLLPRNSYTFTSVVFSNLSRKPFLGQLKCFQPEREKTLYNSFNSSVYNLNRYIQQPFQRNIRFFEAIPLEDVSGSTIYDPLSPLPMNTLVLAAPGASKVLWMRFSSEGMKAGKYRYLLVLKPSYTNFPMQEIELEVEVADVDLAGTKADSGHYTSIYQRGARENLVRFLAEKETNIIYTGCLGQVSVDVYPEISQDGTVLKYSDYAQIDDMIDKTIRHGVPRERIKLWCPMELHLYGMKKNGKIQVPFNSPAWVRGFRAFLSHFTEHLRTKYGIGKDRIIFYTVDEPSGDINDPKSRMYHAYQEGRIIKEADSQYHTLVNPDLRNFASNQGNLAKLLEFYDIIELYRPALTPEIIRWAQKTGKEIWTYGIYGKTTAPDVYRREYWQSLRDGFTEIITYWHLDQHAGGDGFNSQDGTKSRADYGSIYCDLDQGSVLTGRRQEAHDLGREDFKLAEFCRKLLEKKNDPALKRRFREIVAKGAEGDMRTMEACRAELLGLIRELQGK